MKRFNWIVVAVVVLLELAQGAYLSWRQPAGWRSGDGLMLAGWVLLPIAIFALPVLWQRKNTLAHAGPVIAFALAGAVTLIVLWMGMGHNTGGLLYLAMLVQLIAASCNTCFEWMRR